MVIVTLISLKLNCSEMKTKNNVGNRSYINFTIKINIFHNMIYNEFQDVRYNIWLLHASRLVPLAEGYSKWSFNKYIKLL